MSAHVSISSRMYARLSTAARARGVTMASIVEAACFEPSPFAVTVERPRRAGGAWTVSGGRLTERGREIVTAIRSGMDPATIRGTFGCSRHTLERLALVAARMNDADARAKADVVAAEHARAKAARRVDVERLAKVRR